jgi:cell division protein FtsQ
MHKWNQTRYNNYSNRRKRNISYKRLLLSLGFLCIITLMSMAYGYFFAVEDIQVVGNKNISTEEILTAIDFYINTNLLTVRPEEVKRAIQETIPIEDVVVRYKLPHTLILEVKEREISAAFNYLNGFALIDSKGFVVKIVPKLENYSVPVVTGFEVVNAKIAEKPVFQQKMVHFDALLGLIDSLKSILQELSEINLVNDKNHETTFYLYTLDGYQVFLGESDDEKIAALQELLMDIRKKSMGKGLLDISHNTPIFKPFHIEPGEERR